MMKCGCGDQHCVTRIYADDVLIPGIVVFFNPEIRTDDSQYHVVSFGQLLIPACDEALKQLAKDIIAVLRQRSDKQLRIDIGIEDDI
jgi:hypothetical protein